MPADQTPNPVLEVLGKIHLGLGALNGHAEQLGHRMTVLERKQAELNNAVIPLRVELIPVAASTIVQQPNQLSPLDGWYWDISTVICQGLTAGQVTMYAGTPVVTGTTVTGVIWGQFSTSGQLNWGKKQFYLNSGESIVLTGNGSVPATGVSVSVYGTQIKAPYWGDYAL